MFVTTGVLAAFPYTPLERILSKPVAKPVEATLSEPVAELVEASLSKGGP